LISFALFAQNITVTGIVKDENGEAVIGATIIVSENTTHGVVTDVDGRYTLENVPSDGTLTFSYVGMKTQSIPVSGLWCKSSIWCCINNYDEREYREA